LQLILGIIMSSKRVQSTWVPQPQKNNQSLSSAQQLTPKLARKEPGSYDEKVAANSIREFLVQKKNQSEVEEVRGSNTDKILEEFKQELTKVKANLPHK